MVVGIFEIFLGSNGCCGWIGGDSWWLWVDVRIL